MKQLLALCLLTSIATAQLYSVGIQGDNTLRQIDPATGATMSVTPIVGAINGLNGIAEDPVTGTIYVVHDNGAFGPRDLGTLDLGTGALTIIGSTGIRLNAIAFDSAGNLFGLASDGSGTGGDIHSINPATGATTFGVSLGDVSLGSAMTFDPQIGMLVYWDGCPPIAGALVDPNTFAVSPIPGLPTPGSELRGSTANVNGNFYANDLGDTLFEITLTGTTTTIGVLDHGTHGIFELGGGIPCNGLYPGTGDDLLFRAGINGTLRTCSQQQAILGDVLELHISSPMGGLVTTPSVITGQFFATGTTAPFINVIGGDGIWVDPFIMPGPFIVFDGQANPFGGLGLPPQGLGFQFFVGAGLTGVSCMLNCFTISALAGNNIFGATEGIEIQFM